jgi:hypothetical protein
LTSLAVITSGLLVIRGTVGAESQNRFRYADFPVPISASRYSRIAGDLDRATQLIILFFKLATPEMLVHESRILQVTLFGTLKDNMHALDFSLLLPDVMTIADEVDAQLTQTMGSYIKAMHKAAVA